MASPDRNDLFRVYFQHIRIHADRSALRYCGGFPHDRSGGGNADLRLCMDRHAALPAADAAGLPDGNAETAALHGASVQHLPVSLIHINGLWNPDGIPDRRSLHARSILVDRLPDGCPLCAGKIPLAGTRHDRDGNLHRHDRRTSARTRRRALDWLENDISLRGTPLSPDFPVPLPGRAPRSGRKNVLGTQTAATAEQPSADHDDCYHPAHRNLLLYRLQLYRTVSQTGRRTERQLDHNGADAVRSFRTHRKPAVFAVL